MANHLENIEQLLCYTLNKIDPERVIDVLYEKINELVEIHIAIRDLANFVSYFKFVLSAPIVPKKLILDFKLVRHFVQRTYAGFDKQTQEYRANKIYEHIKKIIGDKSEINKKSLSILEYNLSQEAIPTFDKLKERIFVATLLKWLQGPLRKKLSNESNDYVAFLATTFGQYETKRILNVEKELHNISEKDLAVITSEQAILEAALMDAIQVVRKNLSTINDKQPLREQFRVAFESLDNLMSKVHEGGLDEVSSFRDKIIVATALIYLQDDFIKKEPEVKNLINLFVSLYFQFRDRR